MVTTTAVLSRDPAAPFTVEAVEIDEPRDDEILVRVQATGICHTDLISRAAGAADRPVLLGHEGAGVVEAVGASVTGVRPGDRVVLTFRHCGTCRNCRAGRPAYCVRAAKLNQFGPRADRSSRVTIAGTAVLDGFFGQSSFAAYALTTSDNTVVVDTQVDPAILAPLGCGFLTGAGAVLNVLRPDRDARVAVYGAGAVGMAGVLAALASEVAELVVVEPSPFRRALALELGATAALDPAADDIVPAMRKLTDGGATHALDTTGSSRVLATAAAVAALGGTVVAVGLGTGVPEIDLRDIVLGGKGIRGCLEGDAVPATFIPHLLDLHAAGRFPIDRLVTAYPHTDINAALAQQRDGKVVKPVLTW
ncbi:NAD(P)-dependent alcohol dehydrogenase [Nocardia gamkensis]|uniref:NAD(P)-dependent alcohol dehydrogenase n=1 Tax=Nocardia gamkensis TaxID=352869 RepID=A0A7X6L6C9_9NOCA|nr:NAD(P)-dependent alcohol dehydrogenase [Nocardia gamkensis]NKY28653.1 NAD(P)-dependent alcohol dehydrogenase [Nocardia gamkensis]NQE67931.1 Aryl-alcohol dehydrogenase [Nocardia gamkensis]